MVTARAFWSLSMVTDSWAARSEGRAASSRAGRMGPPKERASTRYRVMPGSGTSFHERKGNEVRGGTRRSCGERRGKAYLDVSLRFPPHSLLSSAYYPSVNLQIC